MRSGRAKRTSWSCAARRSPRRCSMRAVSAWSCAPAPATTRSTWRRLPRGIYVSNCPGKNAIAVAELAFGLMLSLDRRIPDNVAELRAGMWNKQEYSKARGLYGQHAGAAGHRQYRPRNDPPRRGVRTERRASGVDASTARIGRSPKPEARELGLERELRHGPNRRRAHARRRGVARRRAQRAPGAGQRHARTW